MWDISLRIDFWVWTWDIHPQAMAFWEWTLWLTCGILWMWDTPNLKTHPCHRISESVFSCDLYTSVAMHEASWNNLLVAIRDHIYTDWGLNPQNSACRISHTAWNAVFSSRTIIFKAFHPISIHVYIYNIYIIHISFRRVHKSWWTVAKAGPVC